jgi:hypothetical protein
MSIYIYIYRRPAINEIHSKPKSRNRSGAKIARPIIGLWGKIVMAFGGMALRGKQSRKEGGSHCQTIPPIVQTNITTLSSSSSPPAIHTSTWNLAVLTNRPVQNQPEIAAAQIIFSSADTS